MELITIINLFAPYYEWVTRDSMNYTLKSIPERTAKPRETGYTMVMDKGLSIRQAEDMIVMWYPCLFWRDTIRSIYRQRSIRRL